MPDEILQALTVQQDYLWFCGLLVWLGAGALWLATRHRLPALGPAWPGVVIATGLVICIAEFLLHVFPPATPDEELVARDLVLFALQFLQALAPVAMLLRRYDPAGQWRSWLAVGAGVLALTIARRHALVTADFVAHLSAVALGLWAVRGLGSRAVKESAAMVLGNFSFLFATTGIFSELFLQQRRFVELSTLAAPSALLQLLHGAVWLAVLLPVALAHLAPGYLPARQRPREVAGLFIAVWLATGFLSAWWTGRHARAGFEESLLARARVCIALLRPEGLEAILRSGFRLGPIGSIAQPTGRNSPIARAPVLVSAGRLTRHDLDRIQGVNPDIYWAQFMTLRDGYLITASLAERMPAGKDVIPIHRAATPRDLADWAERRAYVEGPLLMDYGEVLRVCAPVTGPDGRMLGWLGLESGATQWARTQAVARFQAFALMGIGTSLVLLIFILRLRSTAQEAAQQAARAASAADQAKTVFLAKVSHELRTPVQSILGYSELMQDHPDAPNRDKWIQALTSQGRLLIRLVNDLIDLSALQSGAFRLARKPGQLAELVHQTVEAMRPLAAAKGLTLVAEISDPIPAWVLLDETRVRQVLLNLIGNALKFTSRGGVRVRLQPGPAAAGGATLALSVEDTGPGISTENQSLLFRPFHRLEAHAAVEGAGLGLALSRALSEAMGGTLTVASDGTTGSTFTALWALEACPAPEPVITVRAPLAGCRVLVVDDNALVAEFFLAVLRGAGAWCDRATTGLEAVALAAKNPYEVVTMDLSMAGLGGVEAAQQILAGTANPPRIIGVSAHVQPEDRDRAVAAGMETLLVKPVSSRDLLDAVAAGAGAGAAPPRDLALIRRLRAQFDRELPGLHSAIALAVGDRDFPRLRERVHYLKNSADIIQFAELSALCARVEAIATPDGADYEPSTTELLAILGRLVAAPSRPPFRPPAG